MNFHDTPYQSRDLLTALNENTGLYLLIAFRYAHHDLTLIFQKMEAGPRLLNGEHVEFIVGQSCFRLKNVSDLNIAPSFMFENDLEKKAFEQHGILKRDILDFYAKPRIQGGSDYLLATTEIEEISFHSESLPLIEHTFFPEPLHQETYLNLLINKSEGNPYA